MSGLQVGELESIRMRIAQYISRYQCPICKTEIREILTQGPNPQTSKRFCMNCGNLVWTICDCGTNLRYDVEVCPSCGIPNPNYLGDPNIANIWLKTEEVNHLREI